MVNKEYRKLGAAIVMLIVGIMTIGIGFLVIWSEPLLDSRDKAIVWAFVLGLAAVFMIISAYYFVVFYVFSTAPVRYSSAKSVSKTTKLIPLGRGAVNHYVTFVLSDGAELRFDVPIDIFNVIPENASGRLWYKAHKGRLFFVEFEAAQP
jgi:hypothetical protein